MTNPPQRPVRPELKPATRARGWLTVVFSLIAIGLTLAFISAFSIAFTIVLGLFVGVITFHYVVWGWWLSKALQIDDEVRD